MNIKTLILTLKTEKPVKDSASKLRGYIGKKFPEYPILHHHIDEVGYLYTYPKVQYKILGGTPVILGIEEGAEVLKKISSYIDEIQLGKRSYRINEIQMNRNNADFGPCRESRNYQFVTPWLALNPANYRKFREMRDWKERKALLNSTLIGNILSMCKGLDYIVTRKLYSHSRLDEEKVEYKAIPHLAFTGEFKVNFKIPNLFGLGKGVSQGFGIVRLNPIP